MKRSHCLILFSLATISAPVRAETFSLTDGSVIEGTIVRALGNTFSIKLDGRGMLQLPDSKIDRVEIATTDGKRVVGNLVSWTNGLYLLITDQGLVEVANGEIVRIVNEGTADIEEQPLPGDASEATAPAPSPAEEYQPRGVEPTM